MPIINRVAEFHPEIAAWRQDIHQNPELLYDVHRTAGKVAELLTSFGVDEVVTGIGRTGVVGVIKGRGPGKTIGLRADMDALPIVENTGKPYASQVSGKMHACGHDGHTAMLLGAAKYLAETRSFDGTAVVIFQPAEEGGAGGRAMVEDGLMDRFGIDEVYGMHNWPGVPAGTFHIREGGMMAASDKFTIDIIGTGGHAAIPHVSVDPVIVAAHLITALQTIVSRDVDPTQSAVVTVTMMKAGDAFNIIPRLVSLTGTARSLDPAVRDLVEERLHALSTKLCESFGATARVNYSRGYPVTVNSPRETGIAAEAARVVAGNERVDTNAPPSLGGEDFSYMLEARPGAFIFLGNGDSSGLHSDDYDFNDDIIPAGVSYWVRLVEQAARPE